MHSNFYSFFDAEKGVDKFVELVRQIFVPNDNVEVQGSVCLVNDQPAPSNVIIELKEKKMYHCVFLTNL